jgi:hypothetical protein
MQEAPLCVRVTRDLYEAARRAAGLPETASQGQVVRYALAVVAGRDPASETYRPPGRPWHRERQRVQT